MSREGIARYRRAPRRRGGETTRLRIVPFAPTASIVAIPRGIAVDSRGNVYVATYYHHRVRMIDPVTGIITTVAGNGSFSYSRDGGPASLATLYYPSALAVDGSDNLYIADSLSNRVRKIDAKSGIITSVANASVVRTVAVDSLGNVYFAGDGSGTVYRFDPRDGTTAPAAMRLAANPSCATARAFSSYRPAR